MSETKFPIIGPEDRMTLAPGAVLLPLDTTTKRPVFLVRMANARQFQVTESVLQILQILIEPHNAIELSQALHDKHGVHASTDETLAVFNGSMAKTGIIVRPGETAIPSNTRSENPLALTWRANLLPAPIALRFSGIFRFVFHPFLVGILFAGVICAQGLVFSTLGWPQAMPSDLLNRLPLLYLLLLISTVLHEFGHLAACRYFGCNHGALGIGLYFFSPVFFVDVSEAWRLKRIERAVIDIGGIYFNQISILIYCLLYLLTKDPLFVWASLLINLSCILNLNPIIKLDGYWLVSDLSGVTNLHQRSFELIKKKYRQMASKNLISSAKSDFHLSENAENFLYTYVIIGVVAVTTMSVIYTRLLISTLSNYPDMLKQIIVELVIGEKPPQFSQLSQLFFASLVIINLLLLLLNILRPIFYRITPLKTLKQSS